MKKILALFLTGLMTFGLMACGNTTDEPENKTMPENMTSMAAPIDALARCMLEQGLEYDPQDPEFFWTALFYFTGAYGLNHELVEEEEGTYQLKVPTPVMQEHAAALFADYEDLYDLPSIMKGNVSYDPDWDAYAVSRGDIGLSEMKFSGYEETEDGYSLTASLWSTGPETELIHSYAVTLADNAYADGIENPLYFYSVTSITPLDADDMAMAGANKATAIFNGLADSHTTEMTMPDGSVQAFQFDANSDVAAILSNLEAGDGVTIAYLETGGGSMTIISVE